MTASPPARGRVRGAPPLPPAGAVLKSAERRSIGSVSQQAPAHRADAEAAGGRGPVPGALRAADEPSGPRTAASPMPAGTPVAAVRTAVRLLRGTGIAAWVEPDGTVVARDGGREVRCSVTWRGPLDLPGAGDEYGVQQACGLAHVHGRRYGRPTPIGVDYACAAAAVLAGLGTLSALAAGRPRLSTSVAQAALVCVSQYLAAETAETTETGRATEANRPGEPGRSVPAARLGVPDRSFALDGPAGAFGAAGDPAVAAAGEGRGANTAAQDGVPASRAVRCVAAPPLTSADGCRFELEALTAEAWRDFWSGLGAARGDIARGWPPFQQRYATAVCDLPAALVRLAAARPYRELAAVAARCGADLTPLREGPDPMAATALPWAFTTIPACCAPAASGAPTSAARTGIGGEGPGCGARPLDGLVVVEVTRRVQGPLATHLLALLGARVIRVEPPGGDPLRGVPPMAGPVSARFHALNHRKQPVEADLATEAGRAAVRELAAGADVFVHSLAPGKDAALGLDAARLAAARPGLVYARASGWGDERGERPPVGTDFPVQAYSGLSRLVTPPGRPAAPSLMTLTDVLGGMICAQGAVAALLRARRDGIARRVDTSLLSAARLLCDPELRPVGGQFAPGPPYARAGCDAAACCDAPADRDANRDASPYLASCPPRDRSSYREPFSALARDPGYAPALHRDGCVLVRAPWDFT